MISTLCRFRRLGLGVVLYSLGCAVQAQVPVDAAPSSAAVAATPLSKSVRKALPAGGHCSVAEFRTLALEAHQPQERSAQATQWLLKHGVSCSEEQMAMIRANRALWLGVADTVVIMGLMDRIVEARQSGRTDVLQSLYAGMAPERTGHLEVQRVNGGLRPVVPPSMALPSMVLGVQVPPPGDATVPAGPVKPQHAPVPVP